MRLIRRFPAAVMAVLVTGGCGRVGFDPLAPADASGPFQDVVPLPIPGTVDDPTMTGDGFELYYNADGSSYIARVTRASTADPWSAMEPVAELNVAMETNPEIAYDGLTISFCSNRDGAGGAQLYVATRASRTDPWGGALLVAELSVPGAIDCALVLDGTGLVGVFESTRNGPSRLFDLFLVTRIDASSPWEIDRALDELNTDFDDESPFLTADGLTLYFDSSRGGGKDIYRATRPTRDAPFDPPVPVDELNTAANESDPWISPDGRTFLFTRANTLHMATR